MKHQKQETMKLSIFKTTRFSVKKNAKAVKCQSHYLDIACADLRRFMSSADNVLRRFSSYASGFSAASGVISTASSFVRYFLGKSTEQATQIHYHLSVSAAVL